MRSHNYACKFRRLLAFNLLLVKYLKNNEECMIETLNLKNVSFSKISFLKATIYLIFSNFSDSRNKFPLIINCFFFFLDLFHKILFFINFSLLNLSYL